MTLPLQSYPQPSRAWEGSVLQANPPQAHPLPLQNQVHFPSSTPHSSSVALGGSPTMPQQRPAMPHQSHTRSSSFFSFLSSKQSQETSSSNQAGPTRKLSIPGSSPNGALSGARQYATPNPTSPSSQSTMQPPPILQQTQQQPQPSNPTQQQTSSPQPLGAQSPQSAPQNAQPTSPQPAPLHPEIRSVVSLTVAHAHKIYFSGPLVRRIERQPDGQKPAKDEGWTEVWAQLGGTTLSIWDMKEIQEASRQGKEVPPAYVNVTDAFVQVLGSVTVPGTATQPSKRYTNVLTLNTAGSNLLLFSCPSTNALISWAAALRLSAWEKSRLEEIYTAHLIRITLSKPNVPTTLVRGRLEGWVRIRVAGQTDWKRVWMVVAAGAEGAGASSTDPTTPSNGGIGNAPTPAPKKKRMSNLFSRDHSPPRPLGPAKPTISMYLSQKPKDKKKPLLSFREVTQAFGVYPERPELISRSTLIKIEGLLGDEELAQSMKSREGWILLMPELEGSSGNQAAEMLKWVIAIHDAFELYGRPKTWTWDPREPTSLMFAYPVGPQRDLLFLDREIVETLDPRDDRTSAIRSRLMGLLTERMRSQQPQLVQQRPPSAGRTSSEQPPILPPLSNIGNGSIYQNGAASSTASSSSGPQLPPLSFSGARAPERILTPITEGGSTMTHGKTLSMGVSDNLNSPALAISPGGQPAGDPSGSVGTVFGRNITDSPPPKGPATLSSSSNTVTTGVDTQPPIQSAAALSNPDQIPAVQSILVQSHQDHASTGPHSTTVLEPKSPMSNKTHLSDTQPQIALVSPYSPVNKPIDITLTESRGSTSSGPRPRSPTASVLTSPYSYLGGDHQADAISVLTSPHSAHEGQEHLNVDFQPFTRASLDLHTVTGGIGPKSPTGSAMPTARKPSHNETEENIINEAGALYFMQQSRLEGSDSIGLSNRPRQVPMATTDDDEEDGEEEEDDNDDDSDSSDEFSKPTTSVQTPPINNRSPPARQGTPMAFMERLAQTPATSSAVNPPTAHVTAPSTGSKMPGSPSSMSTVPPSTSPGSDRGGSAISRAGLGRKPSGARAQATPRVYNGSGISVSHQLAEEEETPSETSMQATSPAIPTTSPAPSLPINANNLGDRPSMEEPNDDVLAALSYLNVTDGPTQGSAAGGVGGMSRVEPLKVANGSRAGNQEGATLSASSSSDPGLQFKSSFAPSSSAAKRKAKAQAQQAAHNAAVHKPGRANGKKKSKKVTGAWNDSTEEEDEDEDDEDEDEDEDADSDTVPTPMNRVQNPSSSGPSSNASARPSMYGQFGEGPSQYPSHLRPPRTLPQPPGAKPGGDDHHNFAQPRRLASDQYSEAGRRTYYDDGTQIRTQSEFPPPGVARQSVWSQVLDPGKNVNPVDQPQPQGRGTFVQLDPAETMTKAFTPQGLLSAGLQDKQDRSAKRQEELARETGASLINVPNKPPPPQTGLLGAITAHERERKREGGVGAALTEREREKRLAEERQRRFDEQQRQQMEQMQQGGSMYGAGMGFNPMMNPMMMGMNPMMMNPMMTGGGLAPMMTGAGVNPMMTGGGVNPMMTGGGMNPMMGFPGMLNPQQMFAAQQAAAAAYQQAMMAFSVAGSQIGSDAGGNTPGGMSMTPNMTGNNMGAMGGFDPRMSMMGMPMMGGMMGMGSPMTGNFDSRFPPGNGIPPSGSMNGESNGLLPPTSLGGPGPSQLSSNTNSPVGRGSPLARVAETADQSARPATPRH